MASRGPAPARGGAPRVEFRPGPTDPHGRTLLHAILHAPRLRQDGGRRRDRRRLSRWGPPPAPGRALDPEPVLLGVARARSRRPAAAGRARGRPGDHRRGRDRSVDGAARPSALPPVARRRARGALRRLRRHGEERRCPRQRHRDGNSIGDRGQRGACDRARGSLRDRLRSGARTGDAARPLQVRRGSHAHGSRSGRCSPRGQPRALPRGWAHRHRARRRLRGARAQGDRGRQRLHAEARDRRRAAVPRAYRRGGHGSPAARDPARHSRQHPGDDVR